ncbi:MAG: protein disulfide isomerase family protein [Candidatus Diapherotrites archaeon]|nr:protein disulfide isomerase family protein [Candidatus Diapherotrites archaeon]
MDPKKAFLVVAATTIVVMAAAWFFFTNYANTAMASLPAGGSVSDEFAKCLTAKGVVLAGTEWCPHCQKMKAMFGSSFAFVNFKDCDKETEWCTGQGIQYYPTWVLPDGSKEIGEKTIEQLSLLSGCTP